MNAKTALYRAIYLLERIKDGEPWTVRDVDTVVDNCRAAVRAKPGAKRPRRPS